MEHSLLHALQSIGLAIALGGAWLVLGLLLPACRALGIDASTNPLATALHRSAVRWTACGAFAAAGATVADLFVQTAEIQGRTVYAGVDFATVARFTRETNAGFLGLTRAILLLLAGVAARWRPRWAWWPVMLAAGGAVIVSSLVSHAAAQPAGRAVILISQMAHISGVAAWLGILVHLLAARHSIASVTDRASLQLLSEIVTRFSPWAISVVSLLFVSGLISFCRFIPEASAVFTSAYGLTLSIKFILLGVALFAGLQNHLKIRPALRARAAPRNGADIRSRLTNTPGTDDACQLRFTQLLELEVTAGLLVIAIAGVAGSISPPGDPGVQRLTSAQIQVLTQPRWPSPRLVDPASFYGAPERTLADREYSEFMHHWSGVAVCIIGCCWLLQSIRREVSRWAERVWPGFLMVFGVFILLASDPEVWWLNRVTVWQVLADPQVLEHQVGGVMVLLIAWLAWRDRHRPEWARPLGYLLPVLMVCGSLLLLGHAHSALTASEELTSLVNVQHAVFGGLGLLAGVTRWLSLRRLCPERLAAWLWPGLVIGLGLFMAFCYREIY